MDLQVILSENESSREEQRRQPDEQKYVAKSYPHHIRQIQLRNLRNLKKQQSKLVLQEYKDSLIHQLRTDIQSKLKQQQLQQTKEHFQYLSNKRNQLQRQFQSRKEAILEEIQSLHDNSLNNFTTNLTKQEKLQKIQDLKNILTQKQTTLEALRCQKLKNSDFLQLKSQHQLLLLQDKLELLDFASNKPQIVTELLQFIRDNNLDPQRKQNLNKLLELLYNYSPTAKKQILQLLVNHQEVQIADENIISPALNIRTSFQLGNSHFFKQKSQYINQMSQQSLALQKIKNKLTYSSQSINRIR